MADAIDVIGAEAVDWAIEKAYTLAELVTEKYPAFRGGPAQFDTLRIATESTVLTGLVEIFDGKLVHWQVTPEAAFHIRDLVHRSIPQVDVLGAIRFSHAMLSDWLMEACRGFVSPTELADHLHLISRTLLFCLDTLSDDVTRTYQAEYERYNKSPLAHRDEALRSVLASDPEDVDVASSRLRYELSGRHHVAVVLTRFESRFDDDSLHSAARRLLRDCRAEQMLLVPDGHSVLWGWGNSRSPLAVRGALTETPGIGVVVGTPAKNVTGFRQTHKDALAAQRIVDFFGIRSHVPHYFSDLHLLTLLGPDQQKINSFVQSELRDLAEAGTSTAELRATLGIYLDNHSPQATANRMYIARNTVAYRLRRIEELLQRPVTERQTELRLALLLRDCATISS
ncbi:PucR family transcriptional regulator [Streptomyces sp. NPDC059477]|uniref:PucR family transcriptional regulator n=1 Tax=Streptomyces sp. NPDC059477 TaxID=3346847 RepID=UPI0036B54007